MLTVDTREWRTNPGARAFLQKSIPDDLQTEQLKHGDFAALDTPLTMGTEHKDFNDLAGSMMSNRLDIQCAGLLDSYDVPILMISGWPQARGAHYPMFGSKGRTIAVKWVAKTLHSWSLRGIIVDKYRTGSEVGPAILAWYETVAAKEHHTTYEPKRLLDNLRPLSLVEQVLLMLPGVGPERAAKMKTEAPNPSSLTEQEPEVWERVLGPVTGRRAFEAWHGK